MFHKMLLDYGKKFTDQWGGADTDDLVAHWAREMAGYSGAEIKRGLAAMDARDWPPTLPEFKKMCRPPIDAVAAYHEAVAGLEARGKGEMGKWSHPAVYWSATMLSRDLAGQPYAQVKERWAATLKAQLERTEWAEIPVPRLVLTAPGEAKLSREGAAAMLRELEAKGIVKRASDRVDHKAWAKRIVERERRGDPLLSLLQVRFAKEALSASELEVA